MVFLHHKIFQASRGLSVYHKRWFYFSCYVFHDHHNSHFSFSATKIKVSEHQIFSVQVRVKILPLATYTSYLKNVHLE